MSMHGSAEMTWARHDAVAMAAMLVCQRVKQACLPPMHRICCTRCMGIGVAGAVGFPLYPSTPAPHLYASLIATLALALALAPDPALALTRTLALTRPDPDPQPHPHPSSPSHPHPHPQPVTGDFVIYIYIYLIHCFPLLLYLSQVSPLSCMHMASVAGCSREVNVKEAPPTPPPPPPPFHMTLDYWPAQLCHKTSGMQSGCAVLAADSEAWPAPP